MSSESQHVGPIIFGHPDARSQLLDEGEVYTFRTSNRTTGDTWARATRTGEKIADVTVEYVMGIPVPEREDLKPEWAEKSGFGNRYSWWRAIEEVHGERPKAGYIYRVTAQEDCTE